MMIDEVTHRKIYNDGQIKGIEDCLKILCFHQNEYDGIHWAIREIEELSERQKHIEVYLEEYSKENIVLNRNAMYNKAIDDFVNFAKSLPVVEEEDGTIRPMWLEEMAEKLNGGEENER